MLPQDTTHLIQGPCYQEGSLCQDPAGNRTTRRPPGHRTEMHTEVIGYIFRSSGPAKTILQGTAKRGRRQGKQKKRWEDNIKEWTGLEFAKSQRAVEKRKKWRKLVVKSSVVPQRSPWLRDRWRRKKCVFECGTLCWWVEWRFCLFSPHSCC